MFCDQEHFNSSQVLNHNRKKLQTVWKGVNSECSKAALTRFTFFLGIHDSNFFSFCNGKLESSFLRLHLERRPQINGMVEAILPFECFLASKMMTSEVGDRELVTTSPATTPLIVMTRKMVTSREHTACRKMRKAGEGMVVLQIVLQLPLEIMATLKCTKERTFPLLGITKRFD